MREFLANTRALLFAIAVHLIVAALVVLGTISWQPFKPPAITGMTIEAVMVDTGSIIKRREQAEQAAREAVQREAEKVRREKQLQEREKQLEERKEQLKKQQEQQAREKAAAAAAEKQRLIDQAEVKREEDIRLQKMREKQAADREAAEKKREDEMKKLREQRDKAAKDAKLQEEKLKQMAARQKQEADRQKQVEAAEEMQRQMASEARAGEMADLAGRYQLEIQAQVQSNWLRPPTARSGLRCTLKIVQIPGGEVISAAISGSCNADEATRRSLVAAVERAGSLPYRGYEDVFQREIDFIFTYDDGD